MIANLGIFIVNNHNPNHTDSDVDNDSNSESNSDGNLDIGTSRRVNNKDNSRMNKDNNKSNNMSKDKKNGGKRYYYCQVVTVPATAYQPETRCGKRYSLKTNNRSRKRHIDTAHPGIRAAVCNFRLLQTAVQDPEKFINQDPDSAMRPCDCGGDHRDEQVRI